MEYFQEVKKSKLFFKFPSEVDKYTDREILKYALGANLYMNGLKDFYNSIISGRFNDISCISICFEDATKDSELGICEDNVLEMLLKLDDTLLSEENIRDYKVPLIFIRVRNYIQFINFTERLNKNQIRHIAGFIFPKFDLEKGELYFEHVIELRKKFDEVLYAMPILESQDIIYKETRINELVNIKRLIDRYKDIVLNIRVGGTDFSSKFGLRRTLNYTIYDIKVVSDCLIDIINMFLREDSEYVVSAPVWEYFSTREDSKEIQGLIREIKYDKENGFLGKTIIHPSQAKYVNAVYAVTYEEYIDALEILNGQEEGGVFKGYGSNKMNEVKPHLNWAKKILRRAKSFGVLNEGVNYEAVYREDNMSIDIKIKSNIYNLNLNNLISLGNRVNNSKRNFLFISKVLGKHIEVKPNVCKEAGEMLASLLYKSKNSKIDNLKICVLGFAETATGLGMAVASAIKDSYYLTTTREDIAEMESILKFEEEHSHATTHKCFPIEKDYLVNADKIILVDDEITTGKSMINIIKELKRVTNAKDFSILSILDWRSDEHKRQFDKLASDENINVEVLATITGDITVNDTRVFIDNNDNVLDEKINVIKSNKLERKVFKTITKPDGEDYLLHTGRFGVHHKEIESLEDKCKETADFIHSKIGYPKKILVLGHGENIYIPSRVASYLEGDVYYKSTTRSPIYCSNKEKYPIKQKDVFYHKGVKYYFYNRDEIENKYDKVVLLTEDDLDIKLTNNMILMKI